MNVHKSGGLEHRLSLGGGPAKLDAVVSQDSDSEEDERDKKFAAPPTYYKKFLVSHEAMAPPDLDSLQKKDYFILYQQQRQVKVSGFGKQLIVPLSFLSLATSGFRPSVTRQEMV